MAYQSHHCSATLPCSVCLTVFMHTSLRFLFSFYALWAMSIQCTIHLLCISAATLCLILHSRIILNNNIHLFFVLHTYSLCAPYTCYLTMLLHFLSISSALPHHHANSSASLVVQCMRPSSLGVISRFLCLSSSQDSLSSLL